MPTGLCFIEPCLPSAAAKPPSGPNWIHEIKHDGYRLMAGPHRWQVLCCDDRGLAVFHLLRRRQNEATAFLYAFDLLELDGTDMRREPIEVRRLRWPASCAGTSWSALQRAPRALRGADRIPARLPDGARRDRLEAARIALPLGQIAGLAEVQEPGSGRCEARGGRGLGRMKDRRFTHRIDMWNREGQTPSGSPR
jgi:hypothetical protein